MKKKKVDIKYLGIPNICFSLTEKNDSREKQYRIQRIKRGFDHSELWSLDYTIASFIYPRLKEFIKHDHGTRSNFKDKIEQDKIYKKILLAFKLIKINCCNSKKQKKIDKGLKLFSKYFRSLWT